MLLDNPLGSDEISTDSMDCHSIHVHNTFTGTGEIAESDSESGSEESYYLSDSDEIGLQDRLVNWVNDFQVKHNAVDSLLKLLKQSGHSELPSTARSLLNTARVVNTQVKNGMQYLHFPLAIYF